MSSTVLPHSARTFSAELTITRVANLNTSRPFIFTSLSASSKWREPLPGSQRLVAAAAVRAQLEAEEAALVDALEHDRAGAVAEEHERRAVGPVEDLGEHVAADDERPLREPGRDHAVGLRERVHEARAAGEQVVGGGVGHAERVGEQRRARREHHVRRHGGDDDQVDRGRVDARVGESGDRAPAGRCR